MVSYLIKCLVCSGILLAAYHMLLEREKMFRFNRFYLLAAMIFPLVVPLMTIEMPAKEIREAPSIVQNVYNAPPPGAGAAPDRPALMAESNLALYWPWLLYILVSTLLVTRLLFQVAAILRSSSGRRVIPFEMARLILVPGEFASYTFFNSIFIPQDAFENHRIPKEILTHELAHARQMHSLDVVLTELLLALCWFNPLLLLYRRAVRLNHEYLADEAALANSADINQYQLLLLDALIAQHTTPLTSSFNYSITKKRLAMMKQRMNRHREFAKKAMIAFLLPALTFAFAEKTYSKANLEKPAVANPAANSVAPPTDGVSKAELNRFYAVMEKHTRYIRNSKGNTRPVTEMDTQTMKEEYEIYSRMSKEQQLAVSKAGIMLYKTEPPVKKTPAPDIFENWKKPHIFGIWLDGKHVPNAKLGEYQNTDIAEYTLYKLVGKGLKGKHYKYQLELTTNEEFDRTFEQRSQNNYVLVRFLKYKSVVEGGAKK